jgi:hypothetical protein
LRVAETARTGYHAALMRANRPLSSEELEALLTRIRQGSAARPAPVPKRPIKRRTQSLIMIITALAVNAVGWNVNVGDYDWLVRFVAVLVTGFITGYIAHLVVKG